MNQVTTWEVGFALWVIIEGGIAMGYFIGNITTLLSKVDYPKP
jgi:hypothetical protein